MLHFVLSKCRAAAVILISILSKMKQV
uniref:Uncharacterized protein n=1 Tax=Rhizophora mucronata TaxID=61149 RepID=A0A2P2Q5J2_RHIMU